MKNFIPSEIKKWFGYNRKERRASLALITIIILVLIIRWLVPGSKMEIIEITPELPTASQSSQNIDQSFNFDPNKASLDTLLKAGLEEREARTLISYRSKGGRFRKPSDIRKIYGIDSAKAERLAQQIVIAPVGQNYNAKQRPLIDLNSCDSADLERLPGIGPVLSARIIKYRNLIGGFTTVDQLREVYGLPPETFDLVSKRITVDTFLIKKVYINIADYKALSKLPYLKRYHYTEILKYRELAGEIKGVEELVKNNIIPDSLALKIKPYVIF